MPRIDLVLALIRAGSIGDAVGLRSAAEAIASEEAQRGHNIAAERVRSAIEPSELQSSLPLSTGPVDGLLIDLPARSGLGSLVLDERAKGDLSALVKEQKNAKKLQANGLSARHRVLLSGPPGNGKTSVAEALAHDLRLPFRVVSYGSLIGSLLGETNRRIETLFTQAATKPCVLFFDEFEALGKERSDRQETGEMKRALASLLTKIDTLPSSVVVVAATNHPEMLDRAVWRRFEIKLVLTPPQLFAGHRLSHPAAWARARPAAYSTARPVLLHDVLRRVEGLRSRREATSSPRRHHPDACAPTGDRNSLSRNRLAIR